MKYRLLVFCSLNIFLFLFLFHFESLYFISKYIEENSIQIQKGFSQLNIYYYYAITIIISRIIEGRKKEEGRKSLY